MRCAIPEGTTLTIGGENVRLLNVLPEGFPKMSGQLVWMGGGDTGIALPEASIEPIDRKAA